MKTNYNLILQQIIQEVALEPIVATPSVIPMKSATLTNPPSVKSALGLKSYKWQLLRILTKAGKANTAVKHKVKTNKRNISSIFFFFGRCLLNKLVFGSDMIFARAAYFIYENYEKPYLFDRVCSILAKKYIGWCRLSVWLDWRNNFCCFVLKYVRMPVFQVHFNIKSSWGVRLAWLVIIPLLIRKSRWFPLNVKVV